jgi:hypothetical protein
MRSPLKLLLITGSLLALSLGASVPATAATTSALGLATTDFACSNGVCEVGPGNVGIAFGSELNGTGGLSGPYVISVISGSLPPGLQLGGSAGTSSPAPPQRPGPTPSPSRSSRRTAAAARRVHSATYLRDPVRGHDLLDVAAAVARAAAGSIR